MTRSGSKSSERPGLLWRLDTLWGLAGVFAVALGIRLAIAPHVGFYNDMLFFQQRAGQLHFSGLRNYSAAVDASFDYRPGYLYVLALIGRIDPTPGYLLLKLPTLLADLGLAWVSGLFAVRLAPAQLRARVPVRAVVAAAVLFNPAVLALGAVWGQIDVIPVFFIVTSLLLLLTGAKTIRREVAAMLLIAVAFPMKPQAIFVFPVIGYMLYQRHLSHRQPREVLIGLARLAGIGASGVALWAVSAIPFGMSPTGLLRFYNGASSYYSVTSVWAFNLWGAVGFWRADVSGGSNALNPAVTALFGIPAFYVGWVIYIVGTAYVLWRAHRSIKAGHNQARVLLVAAAMTNLLAFTVLTRMHERYLFPVLAYLAPLILWRGFRRAYVALSALFVVNLWYPFAGYNLSQHVVSFYNRPVYNAFFGNVATVDTWQKKGWSLLIVAACIAFMARGFRWVEQLDPDDALAPETAANGDTPPRAPRSPRSLPRLRLPRVKFPHPEPEPERLSTTPSVGDRRIKNVTKWLPIGAVLVACAFSLVVLRSETTPATNLNDSAFHLQMVHWADHQISQGRVPLDGWFPDLSLGSSFFHHYQSLPYTLTAYAGRITGLGDQTTYLWTLYLLLALWPISVYLGARLLGLGRWPAAAAALVSPLVVSKTGYGYEHGSYTWQGYGVYTQLFGMVLLPITWGLTWRAVSKRKWYPLAALALGLCIATHLLTGYLAVLSVGVWALVAWKGITRRILRAALVVISGVVTASWVLVPLLADRNFAAQSAFYKGSIFNDSYGARKIMGWLISGELFDHGRFPIMTLLVGFGFVVCVIRARKSEPARALIGVGTLSLLLFFGRATWGSLVNVLPGNGDLQMHRFIAGVHMAGIFMAGVGLAEGARWAGIGLQRLAGMWATRSTTRWQPAVVWTAVSLAIVAVLAPAWTERAHYDLRDGSYIPQQRAADATDGADLQLLINEAEIRGGGRIYAGNRANWGNAYLIGSVPAHAELSAANADAIGFTFRTVQALSTDIEASFNESNPAQYQMMNIRYVIVPSDRQPAVPAKLIDSQGRHRLYEVSTSGYMQVADVIGSVTADRTDLAAANQSFMSSDLADHNVYPSVAFDGAAAAPPTVDGSSPPATSPGTVVEQSNERNNGVFSATVDTTRTAAVVLKESYDPRWTVTVDGVKAKPVMIAPSLVGVEVASGHHVVVFRYKPYSHYELLIGLAVLMLLGLAAVPRRKKLVRAARQIGRRVGLALGKDSTASASAVES